jgi:hypothetical protein
MDPCEVFFAIGNIEGIAEIADIYIRKFLAEVAERNHSSESGVEYSEHMWGIMNFKLRMTSRCSTSSIYISSLTANLFAEYHIYMLM